MYIDWVTWSIWFIGFFIFVIWIWIPIKEIKVLVRKKKRELVDSHDQSRRKR